MDTISFPIDQYSFLSRNQTKWIVFTILFIGGVIMVTPIIFMISTSFKEGKEVFNLSIVPNEPTLNNYVFILQESKFIKWSLNSLIVAFFSTTSVLFF